MKLLCVAFLLLVVLNSSAHAADVEYNYLLQSFEYSVAIRANYEEALWYYGEYLSQEVEEISVRFTHRVAQELETLSAASDGGDKIAECTNSAEAWIRNELKEVQDEFERISEEANQLHQAINQKIIAINIMVHPMDEFYYNFTNEMFDVYAHLNDYLLPNLRNKIIHLIAVGDLAFNVLDSCLEAIK